VRLADNSLDSFSIAENEGINGGASQSNVTATGFQAPTPLQLTGSAKQILTDIHMLKKASSQLTADLPYLYVTVLSRSVPNCSNALCNPSAQYVYVIPNFAPPAGLPLTDILSVTERAYLLPGSTTGAAASFLLGPTIIFDSSVNACN
jgi:hypothetical protein